MSNNLHIVQQIREKKKKPGDIHKKVAYKSRRQVIRCQNNNTRTAEVSSIQK